MKPAWKISRRHPCFLACPPTDRIWRCYAKGNHLTINIAGNDGRCRLDGSLLLTLPEVKAVLPCLGNNEPLNSQNLIYFKGRFPRGLAKSYTGDRFIMVGDAAGLVRAFKGKGVTSAVQTGIRAARSSSRKGSQPTPSRHTIKPTGYPGGSAVRPRDAPVNHCSSSIGLMDVAIAAAENDPEPATGILRCSFCSPTLTKKSSGGCSPPPRLLPSPKHFSP